MMISAMPVKLLNNLWNRHPRSYIPGALLQRVCRDLSGRFSVVSYSHDVIELAEQQGRFNCSLTERVEAHFMMHVATVRISCDIAGQEPYQDGRVMIANSGWLRSRGVRCRTDQSAAQSLQPLCLALEQDKNLAVALNGLHFRHCEITPTEQGWRLQLEPYAGSEVVNRLPSFRRYLKLEQQQVEYLILALLAFRRILSNH